MRRFGLVGRFALASGVGFVVLAVVLGVVESKQIRSRALANAVESATLLAQVGVQSHLTAEDLNGTVAPDQMRELDKVFSSGVQSDSIARIKIWSTTGRVVYSDDHSLIGQTFQLSSDLREAIDGEASSDVSSLDAAENVGERSFGKLLEVYLPLRFTTGEPVGAFELYVPYQPIANEIRSDTLRLYLIVVVGLALLWVVLFRKVRAASRQLQRDSEALQRHADENEYLAQHDRLTDLPNRMLFRDRCDQAIRAANREGTSVGVLVMNLNRFKEINDALGHEHGDALLTQVGPRLTTVLRGVDTVARLGGDEFGILLGGLRRGNETTVVAEKITAALEEPFRLKDMELEVGASIGIAVYRDHGDDADGLMRHADVAMYAAKAAKVPFETYSPDQDHNTTDRLKLVGDLRRAVTQGDLELYFQPKVDLAGRVVGAEALARWNHPKRGFVPPDVFIPLAEHTGLIRQLTSHVIGVALAQCRAWQDDGLDLAIAVNLSARDLLDETLPDEVAALLERHGVRPELLELEITESSIIDQPARSIAVLDRLFEMGISLAIDDFGTGYSSLTYLQRLPVKTLKIDRSFVTRLRTNEADAKIVRSTIDLGHNIGLVVVAEGVEDQDSFDQLGTMGCDIAQGYHIARPMPADKFQSWIRSPGVKIAEHEDSLLTGGSPVE
ncbi:MAG: EAL domain-containing protein [Actinomycetota bacterium]|nr:EAL domain-containing protein [Actinomycetota bacterium]